MNRKGHTITLAPHLMSLNSCSVIKSSLSDDRLLYNAGVCVKFCCSQKRYSCSQCMPATEWHDISCHTQDDKNYALDRLSCCEYAHLSKIPCRHVDSDIITRADRFHGLTATSVKVTDMSGVRLHHCNAMVTPSKKISTNSAVVNRNRGLCISAPVCVK